MKKTACLGFILAIVSLHAAHADSKHKAAPAVQAGSCPFAVSLRPDGRYTLAIQDTDWVLQGALPAGFTVLRPTAGTDRLGRYRELSARNSRGRLAAIRVYEGQAVVLFSDRWEQAGANTQSFPAFEAVLVDASRYSFKPEAFSHYEFSALGEEGPWIFFNLKKAVVLSPADHFQIATMKLDAMGHPDIGIDPRIQSLPRGFSRGTILAAGSGVNSAMRAWGSALQSLGGKHGSPSDAHNDPVLSTFGYWTDNGGSYYYKFEPNLGYAGTLLAVKDQFAKMGYPLGYMQLDSWFYPKGPRNSWDDRGDELPFGEDTYRADKQLFPDGLASFQRQLGLPLVTHARWVASGSPYRKEYKMSGNVVVDPKFWNETASYLKDAGVVTYEQDWLDENARTAVNLADPFAFLDDMAHAMKERDIDMQYCMAPPSDYMASSQYANLATIRTSGDRFERDSWDAFLYDSRMATALGALPWTDVFMSPETGNLLISTLSGGPVGVGDALGKSSPENLGHVVRADGGLVKPDTGLRPIDRMYEEDAAGKEAPMIAVATSGDPQKPSAYYVFSYPRKASDSRASVSLAELGIGTGAIAYDWVRRTVVSVPPGGTVDVEFDGESVDGTHDAKEVPEPDKWGYVVVIPQGQSGIALIGDPGKFATLGTRWETGLDRREGPARIAVDFKGDTHPRTVAGFAKHRPLVKSSDAKASLTSYDKTTGLFSITVTRGNGEAATISIE